MLATIVDWAALGKVIWASFLGALLLTGLFTAGVLLVEADGSGASVAPARRALGIVALGLCLLLVAYGLSVLFEK